MASKHIVVCQHCGRQFDANRGGYYNRSTRRYTCKACGNMARTGMKQSKGAMIAKIAFGVMFILAGFVSPDSGWTIGYFLTALVIGGALIAWGIIPYLKPKMALKKQEKELHELRKEYYNMPKKCPSCGAMSKGDFCEYCGSEL